MAQKVTCPNPKCGTVFEAGDETIGQTVYCPQCGAPTEVMAEIGQAAAPSAEAGAGKPAPTPQPAGQQCPNCGAALGARVAICPQCGLDIRTGVLVQAGGAQKKRNLAPLVLGGGVILALAVLVTLAVLVVRLVTKRRAEAKAAEAPVAQEKVAKVQGPKKEQPRVAQVTEEELAALTAQETLVRQAVEAYTARLKDLLSQQGKSPEEMAALWADLYVFSRDAGLQTEAEQCWWQAVRAKPVDPAVNAKLGRTETFAGLPATPDQKRFLEGLQPRLRLVSRHPGIEGFSARVDASPEVRIGWANAPEFRAAAGYHHVEVSPPAGAEGERRTFGLLLQPGLVYTATLKDAEACAEIPFGELAKLYQAVAEQTQVAGVTVESNWQGQVTSARTARLQAEGSEEVPLTMQRSRSGDALVVVGSLMTGNRYGEDGQDVFFGSPAEPLHLLIDQQSGHVAVYSGVCVNVCVDLADELWGVLGTACGDLGSEWARKRLAARADDIAFENLLLEAQGAFYAPWQADARACEEMTAFRRYVDEELARQNAAAQQPDYVDKVRALGIQDREAHMYLNWPTFRPALAALLQDSCPAILAYLNAITKEGADEEPASAGRGGGMAAAFRGSGPRGGGSMFGPAQATTEPSESPIHPRAVTLGSAGRLYALMRILPLLPDRVAMDTVQQNWAKLPLDAQVAAMVSLEKLGTSEAVRFLGRQSQQARQADVQAAAMLSLGLIGTPEALDYCKGPIIVPELRAAAMAARVAACDAGALEGLPGFLSDEPKSQTLVLNFLTQMDTPSAFLALCSLKNAYQDADSRGKIAAAMARMGGLAATSELVSLATATGSISADLLRRVSGPEALLLVRPVGQMLAQGKGVEGTVAFLQRHGGDAGFAFVKAVAKQGNADAMLSLLSSGSGPAIEAAAEAASSVDLAMLEKVRAAWYTPGPKPAQASWNPSVDAAAATALLRKLAADARDAKVKLAAAMMLLDVGEKPDPEPLLALAKGKAKEIGAGEAAPRAPRMGPPSGAGGPPPGVGGPPAGTPFGPPQPTQEASYEPGGFQEAKGAALLPRGFKLEGRQELYALGLLARIADETTSARLRELADSYQDGELRAAATRAVAEVGGAENLKFVRDKATARRESYKTQQEFLKEFQERLLALDALGAAQDVAFLPQLLNALQETAPPAAAIKGLEDDYAKLSGWWQAKLWAKACRCLAQICRQKQLTELTDDSELQKQLTARLTALMEEPERPALAAVQRETLAEAVRAFGRCVGFCDQETRLILTRLALRLREPQPGAAAAAATGGPGRVTGGPGGRPTGGAGRASQPARSAAAAVSLQGALRDAVAHLAARGGGLGLLKDLPALLPQAGKTDTSWSALMKEMAESPTPDYFALLDMVFGSLDQESRQAISDTTRGKAGSYDVAYATFVARMLSQQGKGPVAARRTTPSGPPAEGRRGPPPGVPTGPPPEVLARIPQGPPAGFRGGPTGTAGMRRGRATAAAAPETKYNRQGVRRKATWSYDIQQLADSVAVRRRQWALVDVLLESSPSAVLAAVEAENLLSSSDLGPAIAARCLERAPSARAELMDALSVILTGQARPVAGEAGVAPQPSAVPGQEAPLATRRAAVMALRKLGDQEAAEVLFDGLVGPEVQEAAQPGIGIPGGPPPGVMRGPMGGPPRGMATGGAGRRTGPATGPRGPGGLAQFGPRGLPLAAYAARALGTMGRDDLLKAALNAPTRSAFTENPTEVQRAALEGMAYLPPDRNPLQRLDELLKLASTRQLQKAAADAIVTALRLIATPVTGARGNP
jgi:hypothetical protein